MKITICGSIKFMSEMTKIQKDLEALGHTVFIPDLAGAEMGKEYLATLKASDREAFAHIKAERMEEHFGKIAASDAILVLNLDKNDVPGYIGGNTIMELGLAFYLKKKIYLWKDMPKLSYEDEIIGVKPIILNGDINKL